MAFQKKLDLKADRTITLGKDGNVQVEGFYLGSRKTPDNNGYGEGTVHIFKTATETVGVWGKTNLDRQLTGDLRGMMLRVDFTGMSVPKKGRRPAYLFEVQFDKDNTIDVSQIVDSSNDVDADEGAEPDVGYIGESDIDGDDALDEIVPTRAVAPRRPIATPSADAQARTQALLNSRKR